MLNWKSINTIFLYDGTLDGLFSVIFFVYENKVYPKKLSKKGLMFLIFLILAKKYKRIRKNLLVFSMVF